MGADGLFIGSQRSEAEREVLLWKLIILARKKFAPSRRALGWKSHS